MSANPVKSVVSFILRYMAHMLALNNVGPPAAAQEAVSSMIGYIGRAWYNGLASTTGTSIFWGKGEKSV
jgi:hypothetical protein